VPTRDLFCPASAFALYPTPLNDVVRVPSRGLAERGDVKETKVIAGHPILVTAAVDAVKKWNFDSATADTTGTLEIKFCPGH
jgi:hypothetical protein